MSFEQELDPEILQFFDSEFEYNQPIKQINEPYMVLTQNFDFDYSDEAEQDEELERETGFFIKN